MKTPPQTLSRKPRAGPELHSGNPVSPQVCYLCHSLLTLAGLVVGCQDITPDQWVSLPGGWAGAPGGGAQPAARNWEEWEAEKEAGLGEPASSSSQRPTRPSQGILTRAPGYPVPPLPFLPDFWAVTQTRPPLSPILCSPPRLWLRACAPPPTASAGRGAAAVHAVGP